MSSGPRPVLTPTIPGDSPSLRDQGKQLEKGPLGKCHTLTGSWKGRRRTQSGARTQRTVIAGPQGSSCPVRRPLNAGRWGGGWRWLEEARRGRGHGSNQNPTPPVPPLPSVRSSPCRCCVKATWQTSLEAGRGGGPKRLSQPSSRELLLQRAPRTRMRARWQ